MLEGEIVEALKLSVKVSTYAVLLQTIPVLGIAWIIERGRSKLLRVVLSILIHVPLALPPVVSGYLLLVVFSPNNLVGRWLLESFNLALAFHWHGAVLVVCLLTLVFPVRVVSSSLRQMDKRVEEAARSLGYNMFEVYIHIVLPRQVPSLIAGLITSFVVGLGEFGAVITFVSNIPGETQTLPLAMYSLLHTPQGQHEALKIAIISIVVALLGIITAEILTHRIKRRGL